MSIHQRTWKTRQVKYYTGSHKLKQHSKPFAVRRIGSTRLHRSPKKRHIVRKFIFILFFLGILGIVSLVALFFYYSIGLPSPEQIEKGVTVIPESTKIYDKTGKHLLYTIHGEENRTKVSLDQIPEHVKWATIATEDQDFYKRDLAIDFKGVARAMFSIIKERCFTCGPGGSTITQQLVKNLILTREKTIERKIKEIILAFRIEKTFSRDKILELYLNQISYGNGAYGIEQAAETYFNKPAKELTLAESATLAALPKGPTFYSPYGSNKDKLFARQKVIFKLMLNEGYITEEQLQGALEEKLEFASLGGNFKAPHFVIYVRELLAEKYGEAELERGGLQVITTLDYGLQQIAERIVKEGAAVNDPKGADNAALVAIDPKTGYILAMVGSRDYFDEKHDGNFNVALAVRNPGSSFKPVVYAALFNKGYTPNTVLYDVETDFAPEENKEYKPRNFDGKEHGPLTIRKALAGSINIPAVKALYLVGINKVLDYALQLGFTTLKDESQFGLSLALGGGGVKLLEHVGAYAIFANDGVRQEITPFIKVTKPDGVALYEYKEDAGMPVFPANVARMITDILSDNEARSFIFGPSSPLYLGPNLQAAVKTGTTNEYRDAWTIGYTTNLAAGVWAGNNDYSPMDASIGGLRAAAPMWSAFMKEALKGKEAASFPKPKIPVTGNPILDGNIEAVKKVKIDKITGKLATEYTPDEYIEELSFAEFHSILHYIDKDNPLGIPPTDPTSDPQYKNWEQGVLQWGTLGEAAKFKKPPEGYDDIHVPENAPIVNVKAPSLNQEVTDDSLLVDVEADAKRGVSRVEYYIDKEFRESAGLRPYARRLYFGSLGDGAHTIVVKAFDDVGNKKEVSVAIRLKRGITKSDGLPKSAEPKVTFISPVAGDTLLSENFPIGIELEVVNGILAKFINLFYNDLQGNPVVITQTSGTASPKVKLFWNTPPEAGDYILFVVVVDKNGNSYREEVKVTIK